ncbi:MAG: 30S ribosomal protein S18 [Candidatus Buchananbacteria bacterium RIFCSPHIGHO2_01_FULL_39_8]|uniref:Small ribosomal subunit protein bS18 n=2 Tax=Bacteria candidate phyla TaxID=1783234 RepID=A0A1F4V4L3_UNCKA|nr:MAG: 30S ribosomal protein S18 [candidate division WWE3 bacterium RIFCSPLOWO2_01_FULL_39_13]OGY43644.1 MAG: 30S ribosomal protein S18 [Candidatus Buchananbacteria bacterium RIFCSPHIGHO2_01_FULL_39_8]
MPKKKKKPAKPAPRRLRLAKKVFLKDIDYKNIEVIKQFLSPRFKILPRKVTGLNAKMQTQLKLELKKARIMGLLPFTDRHILR